MMHYSIYINVIELKTKAHNPPPPPKKKICHPLGPSLHHMRLLNWYRYIGPQLFILISWKRNGMD